MRKLTLILALIGMITLQSCVREEVIREVPVAQPDYDTISEVFELRNRNFSYDANFDEYFIRESLTPQIYASDVIIIYRLVGTTNTGAPIWQLIPRTIYFNNGDELDYDFDFSREDFSIYARGTYNLANTPQFITNQTFRIVIIPGYFSRTANPVDYNNYDDVIKYFGIDDKNVKTL